MPHAHLLAIMHNARVVVPALNIKDNINTVEVPLDEALARLSMVVTRIFKGELREECGGKEKARRALEAIKKAVERLVAYEAQ